MVEHDTLVYSKNIKDTVSEDQRAIETFQQRVISGNLLGFHCPAICHFIVKIVEKEGGSYKCHHCDKGKAIVEDASASQQLPDRQLGTKSPLDTGSPSVRDGVSGRAVVRRQTLLMLPMLFGRTATKLPGLKHG